MINSINEIKECISIYFYKSPIAALFFLCLLFLLLSGEKMRKMVVYPTLIMMIIILNPICYTYIWTKLLNTTYWRMLWMIPVVPVIAIACAQLIKSLQSKTSQTFCVIIILLLLTRIGDNIYWGKREFTQKENWFKLPQDALEISDAILTDVDEAYCIMPSGLYNYVRQYSVGIKQLYGRNLDGYISSDWKSYGDDELNIIINARIEAPDYRVMLKSMDNLGYTIYVSPSSQYQNVPVLNEFSFYNIYYDSEYTIYKKETEIVK